MIAAGLRRGCPMPQIGELIGRDKSVVWREVARNRGPDGSYWAPVAHRAAHERRRRPKEFKLVENPGSVSADRGLDGPGLVPEADRRGARARSIRT